MIEIGILGGLLTIFLNYIIGKPGSQFSPKEIFSSYTIWLCKRRLKQYDIYWPLAKQLKESKSAAKTWADVAQINNDFKIILYNAAEPFFTWERAAGMCSVCFGVWVSVICGFVFMENIIDLPIIVITSHATIRIFNKFVYD